MLYVYRYSSLTPLSFRFISFRFIADWLTVRGVGSSWWPMAVVNQIVVVVVVQRKLTLTGANTCNLQGTCQWQFSRLSSFLPNRLSTYLPFFLPPTKFEFEFYIARPTNDISARLLWVSWLVWCSENITQACDQYFDYVEDDDNSQTLHFALA